MIRVLIVEDDPLARQLLEIYVEKSGKYALVQSVESAAFAELCCRAREIDLILMDVCTAMNANGYSSSVTKPANMALGSRSPPSWLVPDLPHTVMLGNLLAP